MSARRVQLARPYTEKELQAHQQLIEANPEVKMYLEELFDMYTPIHYPYHKSTLTPNSLTFMVHQYENCGATFGFILDVFYVNVEDGIGNWMYELKTYLESGYAEGDKIIRGQITDIEKVTQAFGPTRYEQG